MSFLSTSSSPSSTSLSPSHPPSKDELLRLIREDIAKRNMTELVQAIHEGCFHKCISPASLLQAGSSSSSSSSSSSFGGTTTAGTGTTGKEAACLSSCVQKYMGVLDVVSRQWNRSVGELRAGSAGAGGTIQQQGGGGGGGSSSSSSSSSWF